MYLDIVYVDGQPVLTIVGDATRFSAVELVSPIPAESVREIILKLWANVYTVIPNKSVFDEGSQFRDAFLEICELHDF